MKHSIDPKKVAKCISDNVPESDKQIILPVYFEGLSPDGTANNDASNKFNDLCILFDRKSEKIIDVFTCTTEPGNLYKQPHRQLSKQGWGIIAFGYHRAWLIGRHRTTNSNQYPALIQTGSAITVLRNKDPKGNRKTGKAEVGYFGCNTHTVADNDTNKTRESGEYVLDIGGWSAMCLVHNDAERFYNEFMPQIAKCYGDKQTESAVIGQLVLPEVDYLKT
jgi:hypothetical protein